MFIPPNHLKTNHKITDSEIKGEISLKSSHILIDHEIASNIFGNDFNVNLIYYPEQRTLMIAAKSDELFSKIHKAKPHMLKDRNIKGDKTIAIHEILIDNEINDSDRDLDYVSHKGMGILNIKL